MFVRTSFEANVFSDIPKLQLFLQLAYFLTSSTGRQWFTTTTPRTTSAPKPFIKMLLKKSCLVLKVGLFFEIGELLYYVINKCWGPSGLESQLSRVNLAGG